MKKNPIVAAVLNFILFGGGYLYNGKRTGLGLALTVGLIIIRYGEISIYLTGQNRTNWYFLMAGLFCLQVGLAADAYREAKEISGQASAGSRKN